MAVVEAGGGQEGAEAHWAEVGMEGPSPLSALSTLSEAAAAPAGQTAPRFILKQSEVAVDGSKLLFLETTTHMQAWQKRQRPRKSMAAPINAQRRRF